MRTGKVLPSLIAALLAVLFASPALAAGSDDGPVIQITQDPTGQLATMTPHSAIDRSNPFFQALGTNGRSCSSCHAAADGWSVSAADVRARFDATDGTDPIFRLVDGANSPLAAVSTVDARRSAYNMLLKYGDIRVGLPIPANAEFILTAVDDPYGYASAAQLSLFRRPLPATNLRFLTGVQWDARETVAPFKPPMDAGINHRVLVASLSSQARDAVLTHEQGSEPTAEQIAQMVQFELSLTTAQLYDTIAGWLDGAGAMGGPRALANQRFYVGINDPLGADPTGARFTPEAIRLFDTWIARSHDSSHKWARAAILRGQKLFNTLPIAITGVAGLNDVTGKAVIHGHCSTCHNAPNVGNHSTGAPLNIGISAASRRTPDLPLYTLTNITTGESIQTTDPGLALITGKWTDIGKFKGPILRGLAARAPYFHNGSAATLGDVIDFYNQRFNIGITAQQKHDLVMFLRSL